MKRLIAVLVTFAMPTWAEPVSLDQISAYINKLTSAETRFVQYNADGSRSRGTIYIKRPGRMRFEYDPPNEALVLASGGVVAIFDAKSNTEPTQYPLKRTPLNLILGRGVDLEGSGMVVGHAEAENGMTLVTAQDPKTPEAGTIELYFQPDPLELVQWVITDEAGTRTGVALGPLDRSKEKSNIFFSVNREAELRSQ